MPHSKTGTALQAKKINKGTAQFQRTQLQLRMGVILHAHEINKATQLPLQIDSLKVR